MHLIARLLVADLADVIACVLRLRAIYPQVVRFDQFEALIARDHQAARGQDACSAPPQQHERAQVGDATWQRHRVAGCHFVQVTAGQEFRLQRRLYVAMPGLADRLTVGNWNRNRKSIFFR